MINGIISKEIFRAYDIRGIVDQTLTTEIVKNIGRAFGTQLATIGQKSAVIARDGRLSSPSLKAALSEGILSTGCNVVDIGMVPTPLLYFATHYLNISSGIMITGSHNPPNYNGLKILMNGKALYGKDILALYELIKNNVFQKDQGQETQKKIDDFYIQVIEKDIHLPNKLKIVIDCGNGIAGKIAPLLYQRLGAEVIPLFCEVNGHFPNHHPDPGQPKNLKDLIQAVQVHKADLGLAFDGDGDRLGVVDNTGKIIWPDRQLILFAKEIIAKWPKAKIIFDVKCTRHVAEVIKKLGGIPLMWKTGHSLIKAKMQETEALLAGEMSGHLFFKDRWFGFDDALYAGARMLEILSREKLNKTASALFASLPDSINTPELVITTTEENKFSILHKLIALANFPDATIYTLDGLRAEFKDGFGLVRPSNTGPNLILRFEGDNEAALKRIQETFRELLLAIDPTLVLPF